MSEVSICQDAQKNREALLLAAETVIAQQGFDVPLDAIVRRAGVGRATFYRNFADRFALADALIDRELDRLEIRASQLQGLEDAFPRLLKETAAGIVRTGEMVIGLQRANLSATSLQQSRFTAIYKDAVQQAKASRQLRPDFDDEDLIHLSAMLVASVQGIAEPGRAERLERCLDLLLHGVLRPQPTP